MQAAIRTYGLSRRYRNGRGIEQVSIDVPESGIYGFLGPNGAGKTTTIRLLLGLLKPQRGGIELLGQPLHRRPHVLSEVGALVEGPSLYRHLSGRDNLEIRRRLLGLPPSRIDKVLALSELTDAAHLRVAEYSLGMKQRLGIALALIHQPRLLILDEPSNGLDPGGMASIRRMLCQLSQEHGITTLISSHLLGEIEQMATHVGVMVAGRLRFQGDMAALHAQRRPRLAFRVSDPERAWSICAASHHAHAPSVREGWIQLEAESRHAPELIRSLFDAGLDVYDMTMEKPSLESAFFDLSAHGQQLEQPA